MDPATTTGKVKIVTWTQQDRMMRAFKFLGLAWAIGLFCVIIPILHFVLVPGMAIVGIIGFGFLYSQGSLVLGGEAECPHCKHTFKIAKAKNHFPMDEVCESCKTNVSIEPSMGLNYLNRENT
jgi:hypothetical protein